MNSKIIHGLVDLLRIYGFINETAYRNYCIKEKFNERRKIAKLTGEPTIEDIEFDLAKEYKVSTDLIHKIVYSDKT